MIETGRRGWLLLGLLAALTPAPARAEAPSGRQISEALLPVLARAEAALSKGEPKAALTALGTWKGEPDPIHALLTGVAHQALGQERRAEAAYRASMRLDPELRAARVGLARALVAREAWDEAATVLAALVDVDRASAPELGLYARVAYERGDLRLAGLLVERGMVRFPNDTGFRKLDVVVSSARSDWGATRAAAQALLAQQPRDAQGWRQLAAATERMQDDPLLRLATLEAAALVNPADRALARRHVFAQLDAGHAAAALEAVAPRIAATPKDLDWLELGARVAAASGATEQAQAWLDAIPASKRSVAMTVLEARLAIDAGRDAAARDALERLIQAGRATPRAMLWAGQLAERGGATARAEAYYAQAAAASRDGPPTATLYLARLLHRTGQGPRAREVLLGYIAEHPGDRAARDLLEVLAVDG